MSLGTIAGLVLLSCLVWVAIVRWRDRSSQEGEQQARAKLARAGRRARAERPARAPISVESRGRLDGTFDVPPRATITSPTAQMVAWHVREHGEHRAIKLLAMYSDEAVIFDPTGRLIWAPEGAVDLAFRADGSEVVVAGARYTRRPELHEGPGLRVVTPLQAEYEWHVERHTWPGRARVFRRALTLPQGWLLTLVLSPDESHVAISFIDQCEAGVLVVDLIDEEALLGPTLFQKHTNLIGAPVWREDGRKVATAATPRFEWWLPDGASSEENQGAVGGAVLAALVFVQDLETGRVHEHEVTMDLAPGWGRGVEPWELSEPPRLVWVDAQTVEVHRTGHAPLRVVLRD